MKMDLQDKFYELFHLKENYIPKNHDHNQCPIFPFLENNKKIDGQVFALEDGTTQEPTLFKKIDRNLVQNDRLDLQ